MTHDELEALFKKHNAEFVKFERVENLLSHRPDLHAFLLLDRLVPPKKGIDIVAGAEHDEIYLETDPVELAAVATEADIVDLIRCGVRLGEFGLCMFA